MATVPELQARLEALKAQRDSPVARVSYDGRMVEYRGTAEINSAIAELELALLSLGPSRMALGKSPSRQERRDMIVASCLSWWMHDRAGGAWCPDHMHESGPHLGQLDRIELERAREIAAANVERYLELQGTSLT
jgi:hypothetical protein